MSTDDRAAHWQSVYATKPETEVSWFEESPTLSLELMDAAGVDTTAAVIDIGGGASRLVDTLLARGQSVVSVLDLSAEALERARERLGTAAERANWIAADVTTWTPDRVYDVWHDRAAFHFLTSSDDQKAYVAVLDAALARGGTAIIGTFAPDGPERCSGLPVARHSPESLSAILGEGYALRHSLRHEHGTPWGTVQKFQFSVFRRRD